MSLNTFPCNPYPISTEELNKGNNDDLNTRVSALETAVEEIDNDKADLGVIAAEFDAEAGTYEIGDLVTNEGKLYEFTSDHSTPGAWDPTEVTEKTVADEVNFVKSGLTNLTDAVGWDNHKNLLPMTLSHIKAINTEGTWNGNVYSVNGIDYTVSLDNSGAINKITANGTSQYDAYLVLANNAVLSKLSGKNIVLNGATGGSSETYYIQAAGYNGINSTASRDGDSANFTPTTAFNEVRIITTGGKTVTNVDFYPMLRLVGANATFDVYHPVIGPAVEELQSEMENLANLKFLPVTFTDTFQANSNITNGVTVSDLTGGVLTSENQIKGIIMFNGYPYFLFQLTYQGKIILGTDTPRSMQETINVRMVILY